MTSGQDGFVVIIARPEHVGTAIQLLNDESTDLSIERHQQEAISDLNDGQLHRLNERLTALHALATRRRTLLASVQTEGRLTDDPSCKLTENHERLIEPVWNLPDTIPPRVSFRSRPWRRQATLCSVVMSMILMIVTLTLFPDNLRNRFDGASGENEALQLNQALSRIAGQPDEPSLPNATFDNRSAAKITVELNQLMVDLEAGETLSSLDGATAAEEAAPPPTSSSSVDIQRAKTALQLLAKNSNEATQQPFSGSGGPLVDLQLDRGGESLNAERRAEIVPDGLIATTDRSNYGIEAPQFVPTAPVIHYWVQVRTTRNEVEAQRAWGHIQVDSGNTSTVMERRIERTETTVGPLFGIQLGPFQAHRVAKDLCVWLKKRTGDCFVVIG